MIEVNNFTKNYYYLNKTPAFSVSDINITAETGSITGLLGPNGSGKSTIMKAICGFHFPTAGKIFLKDSHGNSIDVAENPEAAKDLIGYLPEKSILPPDMYVSDFLEYAAEIHGLYGTEKSKNINRVISECSLEEVLAKKIKTLSKGYSQRVSLAQSIIHNPPNLILDEPVSGLDPAQINQMRKLIKRMSETKAVIMSTHILQEVCSLCSKIYIINQGKLVANGTEQQIISETGSKNLEEAFMALTGEGNE